MACIQNLINVGGDPSGVWYVTSGPDFPIELEVAPAEIGPYVPGSYNLNDQVGVDNDVWVDFTNMTPPLSYPAVYEFTYVVGGGGPESCGGGCSACATFTLTILPPPDAEPPLSFCSSDTSLKNLFALTGLACVLPDGFILGYAPANPAPDPDFDLDPLNCPLTYGNFIPANITPGVYIFRFTRKNADFDCDGCSTDLELTIFEPPCIGEAVSGYVCAQDF